MTESDQRFERLPRSFKNRFPFRLSAPSFIHPAHWVPNIRMLAPDLDEIEVLLFDSAQPADFPAESDIDEMALLAAEYDLRYNIHLPSDVSPGSPDADCRRRAVDTIARAVNLTRPLAPTTRVLHLPLDVPETTAGEIGRWQARLAESIHALIAGGIPGTFFSVENLDYPLEWVRPLIDTFDMAVCLDLGHLLARRIDWQAELGIWRDRVNMIHLHGVDADRDHRALTALAPETLTRICDALRAFNGTVSVEVFSFDDLKESLVCLEKCWQNR